MDQLRTRQQGVVLFIALIVLVALTLAGIALVRSVDTSNVIAGNLAFKQGTLQAADVGIEAAVTALPNIIATTLETDQTLPAATVPPSYWYYSSRREEDMAGIPTTKKFGTAGTATAINWSDVPFASANALSGNTVQVVIDRLCTGTTPVTDIQGNCFAEDPSSTGTKKAGGIVFSGADTVFYRATVRVSGPRNTVSVVQVILSK
jgi:Tfp pilus assembly protein PilX